MAVVHKPRRPAKTAPRKSGRENGDRADSLRSALDLQKRRMEEKTRSLEAARERLAATLAHYSDLFDNAPIGYLSLDSQGVVTEVNLTASRLLGQEREQLIAKPFLALVEAGDRPRFLSHMRRCRQQGGAFTELQIAGNAGGQAVEIESRQARGTEGEMLFRTAIIDLEDRRRAQAARSQADSERRLAEDREQAMRAANEAKDLFIAELSHELRTPLTPILAAVSSLQDRDDVPQSLQPTIAMIRRNVEIEARLIDDLLDLSRIGRKRLHLELGVFDAHPILADVVAHLESEARSCGVEVGLELFARLSHVQADALRLRQIFWNLLSNAIRNTPRGGYVAISSSNIARDLRVSFRDDGVGIAQNRLEEIFEAFAQDLPSARSTKGLGLGLAIVKGLVEVHGGKVVALSPGKGQGATFVVDLPTTDAAHDEEPLHVHAAARERPAVGARRSKRVLLVEDHADTRDALQVFLELKGYDVTLANSVAAAVEAARIAPDVIVCDIGLPDGSGLDVMKRIVSERPVKAIALTGYGTSRDIELAREAGFAMHMTKPIAADRLLAAIEMLFNSEEPGSGTQP